MLKTKNEELVSKIVDLELKMFSEIDTKKPIESKSIPMLRKMRLVHYSVLSDNTLETWFKDLTKADKSGRNVILEKHEMLSGKVKIREIESMAIKKQEDIGREMKIKEVLEIASPEDEAKAIIEQESMWQTELSSKYPLAIKRKIENDEYFKKALYCELHTWSKESIHSYFEDICLAKERNVNLTEKRFNNLYKSMGEDSLDAVEEKLGKKRNKSRIKNNLK